VPCRGRDEVWLLDPALDKSSVLQLQAGACSPIPQIEGTVGLGEMLLQILGQAFTKSSSVVFQDLKNHPNLGAEAELWSSTLFQKLFFFFKWELNIAWAFLRS